MDDMGLPRSLSVGQAFSAVQKSNMEAVRDRGNDHQSYSRPLNSEEKTGVYVLLGILAGSWVVGGIVNRAAPTPKKEEQHSAQEKH